MQFNFAFVTGLLAATSVLAIPVTIYEQTYGRGIYTTLNLGPGNCANLAGNWKNRMSSFSKPSGRTCRIFDEDTCQGRSSTYGANEAWISSLTLERENRVNSIRCW